MDTSTTETDTSTEKTGEEGNEVETVAVPKAEYDKLNQTLGSLKRELKDLKKPKEESKETSKNQPEENVLLQKIERLSLQTAGITHQDDVELARATAKKWNMDIEDVLMDADFKVKLERQQTARSNELATSNIRGGQSTSQAKNTPEYWIAKKTPPSAKDVPDRKTRAGIVRAMMKNASTDGKKFYND
jgi:hypothetical protein